MQDENMITEFKIVEKPKKPLAMHPKKFALWLFMASVVMLFASLTSAYIVRQAEGNWVYFDLPWQLYATTGIILLSSVTMHGAYYSAKKDRFNKLKVAMLATFLLGSAFLAGQMVGWQALVEQGVYFVGNPSGSFLYVLTGLHGLHVVSALIFLLIVLRASYRLSIHSKNLTTIKMCATYWHFLGGLWLYLFFFLLISGQAI